MRLIPPQYVRPFVKTNKNDAADAEAICEAVTRPTMRFAPAKSAEQQSVLMLHRARELLVRQRTLVINALRGHCAELGLIVAQLGRCRYGREDALRQGYRNGHRERQLTGKKVAVDLPYQGMDNVHILEGAMRVFWKNASPRLSDLLDQTH